MNFTINFPQFLASLPIMLKGMVGIFCVIVVIWLFIAVLNKVTTKDNAK